MEISKLHILTYIFDENVFKETNLNTFIKSTRVDESSSLSLDLSIFFAVAGVDMKSIDDTFRSVSRDLWLAGRLLLPTMEDQNEFMHFTLSTLSLIKKVYIWALKIVTKF